MGQKIRNITHGAQVRWDQLFHSYHMFNLIRFIKFEQIPILLSNASILLTEPIKLSSYEKQEISAAGGKKEILVPYRPLP